MTRLASAVDLDGHSLPQIIDPPLRGLLHQDQSKYNDLPHGQKSHRLHDLALFVMSHPLQIPNALLSTSSYPCGFPPRNPSSSQGQNTSGLIGDRMNVSVIGRVHQGTQTWCSHPS